MRKQFAVAALVTVLLLIVGPSTALAGEGTIGTLDQPRPAWLTNALEAKIVAAGPKGVEVPFAKSQALEPNCLGYAPPYVGTDGVSLNAVSAGTCMVSPSGCTMNFVFTDGTSKYIGTAGHCAGTARR